MEEFVNKDPAFDPTFSYMTGNSLTGIARIGSFKEIATPIATKEKQ
jgi:hypothetical protein